MISIFVYADSKDIQNWRWDDGDGIKKPITAKDPVQYGTTETAWMGYARRFPIPSIVLRPNDGAVVQFKKSLPETGKATREDHAEKMKDFSAALRTKIGGCRSVSDFRNDPLCVFIHFGGNVGKEAERSLKETWELLDEESKKSFLCCAISRNGGGISRDWQRPNSTEGGKILELPSTKKEVLVALRNWGVDKSYLFEFESRGISAPMPPPEVGEPGEKALAESKASAGKDEQATKSPNVDDNGEEGRGKVFNWNTLFGFALQGIVAFELVGGFVLCWVKSFRVQVAWAELSFGLLGLVFLSIPVGILAALRRERNPHPLHGENQSTQNE